MRRATLVAFFRDYLAADGRRGETFVLHDNGFRVAEVSGRTGTPGVFFGCESPRTLILAEKR